MLASDPRIQTAKRLHADKTMPIAAICETLKISRPTLYRWLALKPQADDPAKLKTKARASR